MTFAHLAGETRNLGHTPACEISIMCHVVEHSYRYRYFEVVTAIDYIYELFNLIKLFNLWIYIRRYILMEKKTGRNQMQIQK